jgi:hypothetical protein
MTQPINAVSAFYRIKRTIRLWLSTNFAKLTASTVAASYLERSQNMTGQPAPDVFKRCLMCKDIMPGILINQGLLAPRQICYDCECYYSDNGGKAA